MTEVSNNNQPQVSALRVARLIVFAPRSKKGVYVIERKQHRSNVCDDQSLNMLEPSRTEDDLF